MKRKVEKAICMSIALSIVATSYIGFSPIAFAKENESTTENVESSKTYSDSDYKAKNGFVTFDKGNAVIMIKGNAGQSLTGKRFEVFQLFDAENAVGGESINYTFNQKYEDSIKTVVAQRLNKKNGTKLKASDVTEYMAIDYIQTLNNNLVEGAQSEQILEGRYSEFRFFVEEVRAAIKDSGVSGDFVYIESADSLNQVRISGLPFGYYIIDEVSDHDENNENYYASSLCMVSTANPSATINIKSDYPSIIKKIKEDDNVESVGNDGWNDIADYEIGQTVPFKFESTICDMNGYEDYYYAWHDQMDEELTFHDSKDKIKIVIKKGDQTYTVKDSEYNLITDAAKMDKEDTFMIEILDIKSIIDKNFNSIDKNGHNDYSGMTVTLEYQATLNDKAANDTGRPGFENDVRLEFSNDADSNGKGETGYTPWDTVVCFTYKINGLKTNNYDKVLQGAKFRLYSDPDCKNEVYVKAKEVKNQLASDTTENVTSPDENESVGANGYIVINRDSVENGKAPEESVEMVSDEEGNFTIYGLDQGVYYLKEVEAPDGYRKLLDPIVITISPTFAADRNDYIAGESATEETLQDLSATAHIKEFYDGQYKEGDTILNTDVEDGSMDIKIINEVGSKLPVTGSTGTLVMLGTGLSIIGGAFALSRKKKNEV